MSNNLDLPELSPTQNNKAATIVDMFEALDSALTARIEIDATTDVTITAAQLRRNQVFEITNADDVARIVTLEATARLVLVSAAASSTVAFKIKVGTAEATVEPETQALAYLDGTANGLLVVATGAAGGGGADLPAGGVTGQVLTKLSDDDGDAGWVTPGSEVGGHPYWRLLISAVGADGERAGAAEIRMLTVAGEESVSGVVASSSKASFGAQTPELAIDGDPVTYWLSSGTVTSGVTQDIGFQFPEGIDVVGVKITTLDLVTYGINCGIKNAAVQWSDDGSSWTTKFNVVNNVYTAQGQTKTIYDPDYDISNSPVGEAPLDGNAYVRKDGAWVDITTL